MCKASISFLRHARSLSRYSVLESFLRGRARRASGARGRDRNEGKTRSIERERDGKNATISREVRLQAGAHEKDRQRDSWKRTDFPGTGFEKLDDPEILKIRSKRSAHALESNHAGGRERSKDYVPLRKQVRAFPSTILRCPFRVLGNDGNVYDPRTLERMHRRSSDTRGRASRGRGDEGNPCPQQTTRRAIVAEIERVLRRNRRHLSRRRKGWWAHFGSSRARKE